ncbi:hypothetical protein EOD40_16685 [Flavobacterium sufflavum]|uniref:Uncharacterized protein n=1 Tax=Flavobacterium sufflavum TaxID=1921138 RepID=A0A3S2UK46_9FLAO|nr:hypothetical protein [Flavobacterium sufflavum]RVT71735.1 hypothetical protein EOD40_16685 [Flavobacterium sufflavum]
MIKITIKQHTFSFGSQYKIFIDKKEEFYAETDLFSRSIINIYKPDELKPNFRTFKCLYFNYPKYKIEVPSGERFKLESKNFWKTKYQLKKGTDIYDLYCHKERKVSIFHNDIQIAYWEKEAISYLAGDYYEIVANRNSEKELLIAFCLILDNIHSKGIGTIFNVDFGLIFKEQKSFNGKWKPK